MIHLFFSKPWDRILKKKTSLCKIFNPVMKVSVRDGYIGPNKTSNELCDGCYEIYRDQEGLVIWREPIKKEKNK